MPSKKSATVDDEAIARKAYELWEMRGREGDPQDDWFQAERELRNGNGAAATKTRARASAKKSA